MKLVSGILSAAGLALARPDRPIPPPAAAQQKQPVPAAGARAGEAGLAGGAWPRPRKSWP